MDINKKAIKDIKFKGEEDESNDYRWIFNVNDFKYKNIAIQCETEKESKQLFDIFINNGIQEWGMGDIIDCNTNTLWCEDDTVYEYDAGIYVGEIKIYSDYEIYKFSDIDFKNVWNKEAINEVGFSKIYNKFLIVKIEDAEKYLSEDEMAHLKILLKIIEDGRISEGKKENEYLVVNKDEIYSDLVQKLIIKE